MNALLSLRWLCLAGLLVACVVSGCSKSVTVPMAPVSGMVTVDNVPLTAGHVTYHPIGKVESTDNKGFSAGTIDASGKYTITTGGESGAPLGKYKVTINPPMMPSGGGGGPKTPFNKRYRDKATTIDVEVVASPAPGAYDLKLKK